MKQQKRHQTNLISAITLIITGGIIVFLAIALYNHARLEVRFDTLINYLKQIDNSVAKLDSDVEIILIAIASLKGNTIPDITHKNPIGIGSWHFAI